MTKLKKSAVAFGVACAFTLTGGLLCMKALPAFAEDAKVSEGGYYGKLLSNDIAVAFYNELVQMTKPTEDDGLSEFRQGINHVVEISEETAITLEMVQKVFENENGAESRTMYKQFGAALDSFRYDYADLFYIDFDLLTFDITKTEVKAEEEEPEEEEEEEPKEPEYQYVLTIGAGRAKSYFLYGIDAEELNGKAAEEPEPEDPEDPEEDEEEEEKGNQDDPEVSATLETLADDAETEPSGLYADYEAAYKQFKESITFAEGASVREIALAINETICAKYTYGYDVDENGKVDGIDRFVGTTASLIAAKAFAKTTWLANSEGLARVFKVLLEDLAPTATCVLVSGYYLDAEGNVIPCVWNYVEDGGKWYAVDVARNLLGGNDDYFWLTGETFLLDHFVDRVISLYNHKMGYPTLAVNELAVDTGAVEVEETTHDERAAYAVQYAGTGTIRIRIKTESGWSAWMTLEEYENYTPATDEPDDDPKEDDNKGGDEENGDGDAEKKDEEEEDQTDSPEAVDESDGEGDGDSDGDGDGDGDQKDPNEGEEPSEEEEPGEEPKPLPKYAVENGIVYFYDLKEGEFEVGLFSEEGYKYVEIDEDSADFAKEVQSISSQPITISVGYLEKALNVKANSTLVVEVTVSAANGRALPDGYAEFVKQYCKVENAELDTFKNTITFEFTPSTLAEHSGLRYTFTFLNVVAVDDDGEVISPNEVPMPYSIVVAYDDLIVSKSFGGSNIYTEVVGMPSLVYNNSLSLDGWKYGDGNTVTENMRSAIALSVSKPAADIGQTINEKVAAISVDGFNGEEIKAQTNYITKLTVEGKEVVIPADSSVILSFPYPEGCGPDGYDNEGTKENVIYKVVAFARGTDGMIDYNNYKVIDAVALRQGIIAEVSDFAYFTVVALPKPTSTDRVAVLQTSGIGGTVSALMGGAATDYRIATIKMGGAVTYTFTPESGYELYYVMVNGKEVTFQTNASMSTYTLSYESVTTSTIIVYAEFIATSVKEGLVAGAQSVSKNAAAEMGALQISGKAYDEDELGEIVGDDKYPSGGAVFVPPEGPKPWSAASSKMQMIIVAGIAGGFVLIGAICIIYYGAIKPKKVKEREEEEARLKASRERMSRGRMGPGGPRNYPPMR